MVSEGNRVVPKLSVLICTHNPKKRLLCRTLEALTRQSLARERWELLLIDNNSSFPVRDSYDLSWHSQGHHVFAGTLGKTHAIAQGVRVATGNVLVIVDDDNVLADTYLENAEQAFYEYPFVGAAGGILVGEYESPPPTWALRYLMYLAVFNRGDRPCYAFTPDDTLVCPGAGMVIRKQVVEHYLQTITDDSARQSLDPVGEKLSRAGDTDMMLCAYDVGLAKAFFPQLRLTHLIPADRLSLKYITRLRREGDYCDILLRLIRGLPIPATKISFVLNCFDTIRSSWRVRKLLWQRFCVDWAVLRGQSRARVEFAKMYTQRPA